VLVTRKTSQPAQGAEATVTQFGPLQVADCAKQCRLKRRRCEMFERFTDRARRVVVLAQEEARLLNHNYIGTEHLLLGLVREPEGVAARALESLGISLEAVRQQVEQIIGRGQQAPSGHIPFTPRAKKVLELSLSEAHRLGHNYISTEHILLGLIREGEGVGAQVLVRLGADLNRFRWQVTRLVVGRDPETTGRIAVVGEAGEDVLLPRTVAGERWVAEVQNALTKITERLEAIERHLGITAPPAETADPPGTAESPGASGPAEPPGSSGPAEPPGSSGPAEPPGPSGPAEPPPGSSGPAEPPGASGTVEPPGH
jgi:ATP-dependent Clp protease ATP-binding subunit ClpC